MEYVHVVVIIIVHELCNRASWLRVYNRYRFDISVYIFFSFIFALNTVSIIPFRVKDHQRTEFCLHLMGWNLLACSLFLFSSIFDDFSKFHPQFQLKLWRSFLSLLQFDVNKIEPMWNVMLTITIKVKKCMCVCAYVLFMSHISGEFIISALYVERCFQFFGQHN